MRHGSARSAPKDREGQAVRAVSDPREERTIELIATVSHEIRSPLTTIKGFTKTLLDRWDRLSDEIKLEMLAAINDDADRVTRILTELLDVSRLEAGKLPLHLVHVELRELAEEVVHTLAGRSDRHKVELVAGDPVEVVADREKLRQVLTNFIENAQKYTEGGTIRVVCRADDGWAFVEVADDGPGVPAEMFGRIFEKFARRDLPGSPTGTGLGLYICKGLIEAQGGDIGLRIVGPGSTFWFGFPRPDSR
jgi:signal transduction histidine kinase